MRYGQGAGGIEPGDMARRMVMMMMVVVMMMMMMRSLVTWVWPGMRNSMEFRHPLELDIWELFSHLLRPALPMECAIVFEEGQAP